MTRAWGTEPSGDDGPLIGSLCTGYGGLDLATIAALGRGRVAWCADPDRHIGRVLEARMPGVPNHGDITAVDWSTLEPVDVITAGFPCQDISAAGRRAGIMEGTRSGLWYRVVDAVRALRPKLLVVENVAALRWRNGGLGVVLGTLAESGYDARWRSLRASDVGAAHRRDRVFLIATPRIGVSDTTVRRHRGRTAPGAASGGRPAGQPPRHGHDPADGAGADPDRERLTLLSDRHRPTRQPGGSGREPDPDGCDAPPRHPDGLGLAWVGHQPATGHGTVAGPDPRHVPHPAGQRRAERQPPAARVEGRPDPDLCGALPAANSDRDLPERRGGPGLVAGAAGSAPTAGSPQRDSAAGRGRPAADSAGGRAPQEPTVGGGVPVRTRTGTSGRDPDRHDPAGSPGPDPAPGGMDWGPYTDAIQRWEHVLGRPAPHPTEPGREGRPRLAPAFVEWLMGLPIGWVTDLDLPRTAQLRALGNGVVPQQAAAAIRQLLDDLRTEHSAGDTDDIEPGAVAA